MSQLRSDPVQLLYANDARISPRPYAPDTYFGLADLFATYVTPWWPGTGGLADMSMSDSILSGKFYEPIRPVSGSHWRYQLTGITRDQYNGILPGCAVKLFRTSTDEVVWQTTSDPVTGAYTVFTPFLETHYLVAYISGGGITPDREGTTVNTLVGS